MSPGDNTDTSQDNTDDGAASYWPTILAISCLNPREGLPHPSAFTIALPLRSSPYYPRHRAYIFLSPGERAKR